MEGSRFSDPKALVDALIAERGRRIKAAFPLGLGKPVHLINELVERAKTGELEELEIFAALSLSAPSSPTPFG